MSRFRFDAAGPEMVVAVCESGAAWAPVRSTTDFQLTASKLPLSASTLAGQLQTYRQEVGAEQKTAPRALWVLSSFLLNTWIQPRPAGIESLAELEQLVRTRATQTFGAAPDGLPWAVGADWKSRAPFLCHAMPASVRAALGAEAVQSPLTLALDASHRLPGLQSNGALVWLAFTAPGEVHVVALKGGDPVSLASRRCALDHEMGKSLDQAVALWRLEQARTGERAERLHWLDGTCCDHAQLGELPREVVTLDAPWRTLNHAASTTTAKHRWLRWVVDLQRAFT